MSIIDVVERARREPPHISDKDFPDNPSVCKVFDPVPWDRKTLEQTIGVEIPAELVALWSACGGMRLYCDDLWLPFGLVIYSPAGLDIIKENDYYQRHWARCVWPGDFVFAKFLENLEQPLIRCDTSATDYGSVIIAAEMDDERPDWYKAASSLEEFLLKYMDAHGEKYWTCHYQKKLAERAAVEAQRNK